MGSYINFNVIDLTDQVVGDVFYMDTLNNMGSIAIGIITNKYFIRNFFFWTGNKFVQYENCIYKF